MRVTLRSKILLLIAGTVGGLTLILLGAITALSNREMDRMVRANVQATGEVLAVRLHERGQALTDMCQLLADQPRLHSLRGTDQATIADSLNEWLVKMHADGALLTDQDGVSLGTTNTQVFEQSHLADDPTVSHSLQGRAWTGIIERKGRLMLAVSVPVLDPVSRVVQMTFTAYSFIDSQVARDLKRAPGSEVAFVFQGHTLGASRSLPDVLPTPEQTPRLVTLSGTRYLVLYARLPDSTRQLGAGFVTLQEYDRAVAPYRRFQHTLTLVMMVALVIALAAGAVLAKGLTRPLDGVMQAAATLSRGDWPERFAVRRSDEIGLLQTVFNDMTSALRSSQERLLSLIDADPLTGLDNHRRFQERLAQEALRCAATGEGLSLLLFDLDHFQEYNRKHGHSAGDAALVNLAQILSKHLPEVALRARYGGEEFTAILPLHTLEQAEAVADKIRMLVEEAFRVEGAEATLTVSVGCAQFGMNTTEPEGLTIAGELALSRAKQLGRNRVCRFDSVPGMDSSADPYQLARTLKDGSLATIQALAAAVDAKDPYTQGHSQRVAEYASDLARSLNLPASEVELIFTTGTLHDVGKIGVPDAILKKPGRLDDEERAIMETHPVLGEVIIKKVPQLAETLPGVRHHHERWDGKGYPDGLAGENIPPIARLLAVADTYDAMTSDRPYRKGMAVEIALAEIAKGAGTQFDPVLAEAFVAMFQARLNQETFKTAA